MIKNQFFEKNYPATNSFKSRTSNVENNIGFNYNKAYSSNQEIIVPIDMRNKNNLIHNNIYDDLLNEEIREFQLYINSSDRKYTVYSNPFDLVVSFGAAGPSKVNMGGNKVLIEGTPGPLISKTLRNLKYIKLDHIVLPRTVTLDVDLSGNYMFSTDSKYDLDKNRFLIIKIKELSSENILSTSNIVTDDCFVIYPEKKLGDNAIMWIPTYGNRLFLNGNLGELKKMTIEILDYQGNVLQFVDTTGTAINFKKYADGTGSELLNSISTFEDKMNYLLYLIIGSVDCELNKRTSFEK
jgi:hypothetical protein